jgi:vacuolar-type H+-ATPase subunit E/Vma4
MTSQPTTMSDHLEPVRKALLDRAHERAAARVAAADEVARATLAEAAAEAEALLSEARRVGGQEADAVIAGQRAQAVRQARAVVLGARRTAFDALREQARGAVRTLRQDPDYPRVVEVLRQRLRHELGPAATISDHDSGGLVAQRGGRTLSFTLDDLADRIVDRLGGEVEGLWAP